MNTRPKIRRSCIHNKYAEFYNTFITIENKTYTICVQFTDLEKNLKLNNPKENLMDIYEFVLYDLYSKSKTMIQLYNRIINLPCLFACKLNNKLKGYLYGKTKRTN